MLPDMFSSHFVFHCKQNNAQNILKMSEFTRPYSICFYIYLLFDSEPNWHFAQNVYTFHVQRIIIANGRIKEEGSLELIERIADISK